MLDYSLILSVNFVGKQWTMNGGSYDGITWLDSSPKPTQEQLDALWQSTLDQVAKDNCKNQAKQLLANSDWSALPDVGLVNQSDFLAYRAIIRQLAINPVVNPQFPEEPSPVWK